MLAGCASNRSAYTDAEVTALVHTLHGQMIPEYSAEVFAESLAPVFRMAALQAVQFYQANKKWPVSQAELEVFCGTKSLQPYRLMRQSDGSLLIGWETQGEILPVVRLTTDYVISFSVVPAVELAEAIRMKKAKDDTIGQAVGFGISQALRAK